MNHAGIALALLLAVGAILAIFVVGSANQRTYYQDTYGNTTTEVQNRTMQTVNQSAGPIGGLGGGAVLFLGFLSVVAAVGILVQYVPNGRTGRR